MRKPKPEDASYIDIEKNQKFVSDESVTKNELRLYYLLTGTMDLDNYIDWTLNELSIELRISPAAVKKAINGLIRRGIVLKVIEAEEKFFVNPKYAWRRCALRKVK